MPLWIYFGKLLFPAKEFTEQDVINELHDRIDNNWADKNIFKHCLIEIGQHKNVDGSFGDNYGRITR